MITACRHPVLIVEGPGDESAMPALLRKIAHQHGVYDFLPCSGAIKNQNLPKLLASGRLERFVQHAMNREEGDSVLICVDSDGACPKDAAESFHHRLSAMYLTRKVGVCLFHCEFEALFIACLDRVAARYPEMGWDLDGWSDTVEAEAIGGAKGYLDQRMRKGKIYKETRDQVRFVEMLDFERLRQRVRCFRHLETTWGWLAGLDGPHPPGMISPAPY